MIGESLAVNKRLNDLLHLSGKPRRVREDSSVVDGVQFGLEVGTSLLVCGKLVPKRDHFRAVGELLPTGGSAGPGGQRLLDRKAETEIEQKVMESSKVFGRSNGLCGLLDLDLDQPHLTEGYGHLFEGLDESAAVSLDEEFRRTQGSGSATTSITDLTGESSA